MPSAASSEILFQCRDCRATGGVAALDDDAMVADGLPLSGFPMLPRCACFIRLHRGRLPAAVSSVLANIPDVPALANLPLSVVCDAAPLTAEIGASHASADPVHRRLIYSVDNLPPSRELMVYSAGKQPGLLHLGKIVMTSDHKLSDLTALLKDELGVEPSAQLSRGTTGEELRIPLHKRQFTRQAMSFFPTEQHFLVIGEGVQ